MEEKKKKRRGLFDFNSFEDLMDSMFRDLMGSMNDFGSFKRPARKPLVMGFSMRSGPDGKPVFQEFGNIKSRSGKPIVAKNREPLTYVSYNDGEVVITAELPGAQKKDIRVEPEGKDHVVIEAKGVSSFHTDIKLEHPIKPRTAKAVFKNGILEIRFKRAREKDSKKGVKVE